jgi:peptide/nickel transport system substrate-binding protein
MRRVLPALAIGLVLLLAGSPAASQEDNEGERVERLTVAYNAFENNVTPFTLTMQSLPNTPDLVNLVYDTLFWSAVRDDPEPWLAESAEPSEDYTTWTVHLREGVTWHDGEPFTAEDVAFTFRYFTDVHRVGRYAHHVYDIPPFESAEVIDEHTVDLVFSEPAPTFTLLPGGDVPIMPAHIWEDEEEPGTQTETLPVGTGPFELVEIEPDQLYRFQANEDYFLGRPTVDELVLPIVRDPSAVFAGLRTGELDSAVHPVPPELMEDFEALDEIDIASSTRMETVMLLFNTRQEPVDDPVLRKAIALAIDRDDIVDTVMMGHAEPGLDSFTHPESIWALPDGIREHDIERAQEMLDEAGYELGDDGRRTTPDGDPIEIEVLVSSFAPQHIRAIQLAAEHVDELGITLAIETLDPATISDRQSPPEPGGNPPLDAYMRAMESHLHADPDGMIHFFGTPQPGRPGASMTGYANPEFDAIAEEAAVETDHEARLDKIHELQEIFARDVPAVVLYYPHGNYAYRPAAYDGWVEDPGHGHFTKRSFLPVDDTGAEEPEVEGNDPEADDGATEDGDEEVAADLPDDAGGLPWVWIIVGLLVIAAVAAMLARRRGAEEEY